MKRRIVAVFMSCMLTVGLMTGCTMGPSGQGETKETEITEATEKTTEDGGSQKIGLIYPALNSEFLAAQAKGVTDLLEAEGHTVELVSSDNDSAKELQQLETFASMGMDRIMIFPIGASAGEVGTTLQKQRDQGVHITVVGNRVTDGTFDCELLIDYQECGESTAKMAADWIEKTFPDAEDGGIKVGLIVTTASTESKTQSEALYKVEEYTSKAKVVETYDYPFGENVSKIQDSVEIMLENNPDLKVLLTYSELQAITANETIMTRSEIDKSEFGIFGSGSSQSICKLIKDSTEDKTVIRGSNSYGRIESMVGAILGRVELDENNIYYESVENVTAENVDDFIEE